MTEMFRVAKRGKMLDSLEALSLSFRQERARVLKLSEETGMIPLHVAYLPMSGMLTRCREHLDPGFTYSLEETL